MTTPYQIAERFIGIQEIPGKDDNHQIMSRLRLDGDWPEHDEVPWCSAFVNYIAWLLRLPRSKSLAARSWVNVGTPVPLDSARQGYDVVILSRGPDPEFGHVGFFSSVIRNQVFILGGNQNDSVNVTGFSKIRVVGVRRLSGGPAG
jgi:uncharacterized protein (TIGR02594 family)